jgi:hypothetical protein
VEPTHCNVSNDLIPETEWKTIQQRMVNKNFSHACFIEPGEDIKEIIRKDEEYLESVGITKEQIADRLQSICDQCRYIEYLKHPERTQKSGCVLVEDFSVSQTIYYGAQDCPFKNYSLDPSYHGHSYGSRDVFINKSSENKNISFNSYDTATLDKCDIWFNTLLIHMIRQHGFFEGPNQKHRLEPKKVIEILGIKPNVDYILPTASIFLWREGGFKSHPTLLEILLCNLEAEYKKNLDDNVTAYLIPKGINTLIYTNYLFSQ